MQKLYYTDYPLKDGQPAGLVPVTLLAYDRNKYATVAYEGCTGSIKMGYVYKDPEGLHRLRPLEQLRLPVTPGDPVVPMRKAYAALKRARKSTRSYSLRYTTGKGTVRKRFKQQAELVRSLTALLQQGVLTSFDVFVEECGYGSWTSYPQVELANGEIACFPASNRGPRVYDLSYRIYKELVLAQLKAKGREGPAMG